MLLNNKPNSNHSSSSSCKSTMHQSNIKIQSRQSVTRRSRQQTRSVGGERVRVRGRDTL